MPQQQSSKRKHSQQPCEPVWDVRQVGKAESVIIHTMKAWTVSGIQREVRVPSVWAVAGGLGMMHNRPAGLDLQSAFRF